MDSIGWCWSLVHHYRRCFHGHRCCRVASSSNLLAHRRHWSRQPHQFEYHLRLNRIRWWLDAEPNIPLSTFRCQLWYLLRAIFGLDAPTPWPISFGDELCLEKKQNKITTYRIMDLIQRNLLRKHSPECDWKKNCDRMNVLEREKKNHFH